jgi:hypothetical protein
MFSADKAGVGLRILRVGSGALANRQHGGKGDSGLGDRSHLRISGFSLRGTLAPWPEDARPPRRRPKPAIDEFHA